MSQFNNYGLNTAEKNRIRRMAEAGEDSMRIAAMCKCAPHLVMNYIASIGGVEKDEPVAQNPDYDGYGPLPGSAEWNNLSPQARGGLTRKRNNAGNSNGDHNPLQP